MTKTYRHQKYTWEKPFGSVRHNWSLIGPFGGVNFHATDVGGTYGISCGLEFHRSARCGIVDRAPDHIRCALLDEPCWHDGTSLYAQDALWPLVQPWLRASDHEAIFRILEDEADRHFKQFALELVRG